MRAKAAIQTVPLDNTVWWNSHVHYSKFRRQGIDIICASAEHHHSHPRAKIVFLTGLAETFVKYSELIQFFFEKGFNVYTYDHQSQGLSGRWLTESQSLWVNTFDDYVDDFVYFVTTITKETPSDIPVFVLAHSMGGFIAAAAMSRLPTLVSRAVLCAPMFRMKCGMKALDFKYPLPQTLTKWIASLACYLGLGTYHTFGYFKEKNTDKINLNVYTSDQAQLDKWMALRLQYPHIVATCVTNDWVVQSIRAQRRLADRYELVKTNTLVLSAETDYLVYNRAMAMFVKKAPAARLFAVPGAYHEILYENASIRQATFKVILDFFLQKTDDVNHVHPCFPLVPYDPQTPIYSLPELVMRGVGIALGLAGIAAGLAMILSERKA